MSDGRVASGAGVPGPARSSPTEAPPEGWAIRLFGPFELWDGDRLVRVGRGAEAAAIKLLALHVGVLFREQLCAALWPEAPTALALNRARNVLSRTRTRAPGLISPGEDPVTFTGRAWADLGGFLSLSEDAFGVCGQDPTAALMSGRAALGLYRGHLLATDRYAEWAIEPREQITAWLVALLEMLADASEATGAAHAAGMYRQRAAYVSSDSPLL